MKLHELHPPQGSNKRRKRVGRGLGSGHGKSAGRGTRGQNARSGGGKQPFFEGGQLPLMRRLPHKRGFHNIFRIEYTVVNLDRLGVFRKGSTVGPDALAEAGIVKSPTELIKILGSGDLKHALTVEAHRFSAGAKEKIEAAGGTAVELALE
jgi:large subunit ribosomal protein L15